MVVVEMVSQNQPMGLVLGDYKGSVPLALITQKRGSIGGVSPETLS